jgi:predicted nucleic acid-binding protein
VPITVPQSVIIDSSALVALLDPRDQHHTWSRAAVSNLSPPWVTCEAVVVEALFLLAQPGVARLSRLLRDGRLRVVYGLRDEGSPVLDLMDKYAHVPMSLADACLVRMTETLPDPVVLTTDADFKIYRRHSRQVVPCLMP